MKKIIKLGTVPALLTLAGLTGGGNSHLRRCDTSTRR